MTKLKDNPSNHYIDNKQFLQSLIDYKHVVQQAVGAKQERPQVPEYIGDCFIKIANHLAYKGNFINYSFREDMILDAIENCLTYMHNFDPAKSSNPFAYFTQITYYAFVRRIQKEKKHLHTKYRYISSLDVDSIIRQAHDEGSQSNDFIRYLQKQADAANQELSDSTADKETKKITRKPKYLQALDDVVIDESEYIDIVELIRD
jgi:DNA-directed RNA polymerase specialized sigma24 family protein